MSKSVDTPNGFKRRNTRRLTGPSGEKIILHNKSGKGTLTRDMAGTKCILDVEKDHAMFGFVEKVLDTSCLSQAEVDGAKVVEGAENGKTVAMREGFENGVQGDVNGNSGQVSFGKPLMTSSFISQKVQCTDHIL